MQFDEVLRTLARFFEREHVRYAVIGGLALQAWGYSRFTGEGVDRAAVRDYFARHGLLELFDAIERQS